MEANAISSFKIVNCELQRLPAMPARFSFFACHVVCARLLLWRWRAIYVGDFTITLSQELSQFSISFWRDQFVFLLGINLIAILCYFVSNLIILCFTRLANSSWGVESR
jgi:hypothetical protein